MTNQAPALTYSKDYHPSSFLIKTAELHFAIFDDKTIVTSKLQIEQNPELTNIKELLTLNGVDLELQYIKINEIFLSAEQYNYNKEILTIFSAPSQLTLETQVFIYPEKNTSLSGLYKTGVNLCTQCESIGFRRITFFIDRPDILTQFTTSIVADKTQYPTLLSNGNIIAQGELANNQHFVTWHDPSLKSSYLFALIAGNFACLEDTYITKNNKKVSLKIFAEPANIARCHYGMQCLKNAMQWEEDYSGYEYDLDNYMLVAIDDLNAAAMENKGLNVFSTDYLLASPDTATDSDYRRIASVVAHEYFHNWTGNRITCRDWFQIGFKEGITTFREQQFSEQMFSATLQRINQIRLIRSKQFAEDASPLAHPVRLKSYISIENFYTVTVYYKSAEIARMLQTLVGATTFQKIMREFFRRYDGTAITIEDFIKTASAVAKIDLTQFQLWYDQKGTPELTITSEYHEAAKQLSLKIKQTSKFSEQLPFYIPLQIGAFADTGEEINLDNNLLIVNQAENTFSFANCPSNPILSFNRNFSAPIKIAYKYSDNELYFLMQYDSDPINQWLAAQEIMSKIIINLANAYQNQAPLILDPLFITAIKRTLTHPAKDPAFTAEMLILPTHNYIFELISNIDIAAVCYALEFIKKELAITLKSYWLDCYQKNHEVKRYAFDAQSIGKRDLKNLALYYLNYINDPEIIAMSLQQLHTANNLTDTLGSLTALTNSEIFNQSDELLEEYYNKWKGNHNLLNKWLALNATIKLPGTLKRLQKLIHHPAFNIKNPSNTIALLRNYAEFNPINFHQADGDSYKFFAEQILAIDAINPHNAASVIMPLTRYKKLDPARQQLIQQQLQNILNNKKLSNNLKEIVEQAI